ncbi:hypothetical protein P280DRAFT_27366 [Massarina eburnea CBS 473.64]|uniref:Uncharacterized protein n=1 Tax=Massarina eburnea CBS 473.64 TaxID=1395130 RepID=A0A6A6RZ86_9PLEO|nr:hypothetical protein P280DRAFT_27366 [Massarina eburnea CBS 473.64]
MSMLRLLCLALEIGKSIVWRREERMASQFPSAVSLAPREEEQQSTGLPGMKRGIAIGVAASITLILIALLAHFAYRRRKNIKISELQAQTQAQPDHTNMTSWPKEKSDINPDYWRPLPPPPVEADARTIHELDGVSSLPELPTKAHVQELDAEERRRSNGQRLGDWAQWTTALDDARSSATTPKTHTAERPNTRASGREGQRPELPQLSISSTTSAQLSPLSGTSEGGMSPFNTATNRGSTGASPLSVSPLEEVYLPTTTRSAQSWV